MKELYTILYTLYDIFIPRFITEEVVVDIEEDIVEIRCSVDDIINGEYYEFIGVAKCFTWLSLGLFANVSDIRRVKCPQ